MSFTIFVAIKGISFTTCRPWIDLLSRYLYLMHSIFRIPITHKFPPYHEYIPLVSAAYSYINVFVSQSVSFHSLTGFRGRIPLRRKDMNGVRVKKRLKICEW